MTIFKRLKPLLALVMLTAVVGCKVQVISPAGGEITWGDNQRCQTGSVCQVEVLGAPFTESFTAVPEVGYEFEKWSDGGGFLCGKSTNPTCPLNIKDNALGAFIVASLQSGYVMPIFKDLGADTDNDGIMDSVDEDDDNDGVLDVDDAFPLDPLEQLDTDGDKIGDNADQCADTPLGSAVDAVGCGNSSSSSCDSLDVECGENIPDSVLGLTREYVTIFTIPGSGKTVAQAFTTTDRLTSYGLLEFLDVAGDAFTPAINFWVSLFPGGEPISQRCLGERIAVHGTMRWMISDLGYSWCDLAPNQAYYLNVKHYDDEDARSSRIRRKIRVVVL